MTVRITVDPKEPDPRRIAEAAELLENGGLLAFPTETVYGLGALERDAAACEKLRLLKERPAEKPFTLLLHDAGEVCRRAAGVSIAAQRLMKRFWPGPLSMVLPTGTPGKEETTGFRIPASGVTLSLLRQLTSPLIAPSANPAGCPPALNADEVMAFFDGKIDAILDSGPVQLQEPSTVVRVGNEGLELLREGALPLQELEKAARGATILFVCTGNTCRSPMAEGLFKKLLSEKKSVEIDELPGLGYRVISAGTSTFGGSCASEEAVEVLRERGCDIESHISRPLSEELISEADRIYALTTSHQRGILALGATVDLPGPPLEHILCPVAGEDISDPIGLDVNGYRLCADEIGQGLEKIMETF
ncbi:MAG: L-threonylcarbamoyladenylate synthase [Planctomycetota bacterium]